MTSCDRTVLKKRVVSGDIASAVRTITVHAETLPVGTFKYQVFKYPGDIDIFEELDECCTYNEARLKVTQEIQSIVRKIIADQDIIYVEFKAGYDQRFNLYTGLIGNSVLDYDANFVRRDWRNLYDAKLLTLEEYQLGQSMIKDRPTTMEIIALNDYFRLFWVLRWTSAEVLRGYKILTGQIKLYLDEALTRGSIVKLDTIAKLADRYVEMTNFFLIKQRDKYGYEKILSEELDDYAQSLLNDVHKYYNINTLKAVKRFWMYLAFQRRICDMGIFTPLFQSDLAKASQVISDIEVALYLLDSDKEYDLKFLYKTLGRRLSPLYDTYIKKSCHCTDIDEVRAYLSKVREEMFEKINSESKAWLKDKGIDIFAMIES